MSVLTVNAYYTFLSFFLLSELTSTIGDIDRSLKTTPMPNLMLEKAVLVHLETVIVP